MARLHGVGKKAVAAAESMTTFELLVPEDEALVKRTDRANGGTDFRWTELVTVLKAYQETKVSKEGSKNAGQEYIGVTIELKVAADEGSVNKGKRIFARFSVNPDNLNSDEPDFGTARFINIARSLMPIAGFDFDEDGGIPEDAMNALFPEKDGADQSTLAGIRAYAEILDANKYDSAAKKVLETRRQDVEGFLPTAE